MFTNFTPFLSFCGGALIGAGALILMLGLGRIMGVSGILGGLLDRKEADKRWRLYFVLGVVCGTILFKMLFAPDFITFEIHTSPLILGIGGILVGVGTVLGSGCTSGHGICGISRLSKRSIVAAMVFMTCGFIVASFIRNIL